MLGNSSIRSELTTLQTVQDYRSEIHFKTTIYSTDKRLTFFGGRGRGGGLRLSQQCSEDPNPVLILPMINLIHTLRH